MLWRSLVFVSCAALVYSSLPPANEQVPLEPVERASQGIVARYALSGLQGMSPHDLMEHVGVSTLVVEIIDLIHAECTVFNRHHMPTCGQ